MLERLRSLAFAPLALALFACDEPSPVASNQTTKSAPGADSASLSPAAEEGDRVTADAAAAPAAPQVRLALVITVEDYPASPGPLTNPHEDGQRITSALEVAGFKVKHVQDPTARDIETEVENFAGELATHGQSGVGFFYYSGHGGSIDRGGVRRNYLLPGKTSIASGQELAIKGVRVKDLIEDFETTQAGAVFVVVDACRNTLPITSEKGGDNDKGFVAYQTKSGLLIAFAVADGETTPDDGKYSTFLAKFLSTPGLTHDRVFTFTNRDVAKERTSEKFPVTSDGISSDFVFVPGRTEPPAPKSEASEQFTYFPPGSLLSNAGVPDRTVWAPNIAFPIKDASAYLGSQLFSAGGSQAGGEFCSASNYVYPWMDNFCETRSATTSQGFNCPTSGSHLGSDIRAGDLASCQRIMSQPSAERTSIEVVAVEDGTISNVGSYSVTLRPNSANCSPGQTAHPPQSATNDQTETAGEDRCTGLIYRYLHLNMAQLKVGTNQQVKKGQVIGYMSNDFGGAKTSLHLHFEIKANLADSGWVYVSPYMSLVRAYERDRNLEGIMLNAIKR